MEWVSSSLVNDEILPVIPSDAIQIQQAILSELHGSALGGHLGWQKMDVLLKEGFCWPLISKDFRQFDQNVMYASILR